MKRIITCTLAVLAAIVVFGQALSDTATVYFQVSRWQFDPALGDNAAVMDDFVERVRKAHAEDNIERIVVRGYASPDGNDRFNKRLSARRSDEIASIIARRAGISAALIETEPMGVAWDELRRLVAATPDVPYREEILNIIDNTPVWIFDAQGRIVDGRKKQLMDLRGGRPYRWMLANIFPRVRCAVAVSLWLRADAQQPDNQTGGGGTSTEALNLDSLQAAADSIAAAQAAESQALADSIYRAQALANLLTSFVIEPCAPRYVLALKTNLLYYPLLLPNAELEWLINDNWSVAVEGNLAWWGSYKREKSYRLCMLDAEARRWLMPRAPWHGFYVGAMAGGGWYDLANGNPGHYGEFGMGGLTLGYSWPIGRRLALEAEIGAGYAFIHDREYIDIEGHHVYQRTRNINYFGPIKAKFSIAWRFFDVNKAKRAKTAK